MARTPEGAVKIDVKKLLEEFDVVPAGGTRELSKEDTGIKGWYYMPSQNGMGVTGIPDFVGCYFGLFFGVETKAGDNQPTPNQEKRMQGIRRGGGATFLINEERGLDSLRNWLTCKEMQIERNATNHCPHQ